MTTMMTRLLQKMMLDDDDDTVAAKDDVDHVDDENVWSAHDERAIIGSDNQNKLQEETSEDLQH